jgi:peptide/nickel transport system permease protein
VKLLIFLLRRTLQSIFVIFGLSILIFVIARLVPGNPARMAAGQRASAEVIEKLREQMHLNDSIPIQYAYWIGDALQGNFGTSLITHRAVFTDIKDTFPASLELALYALIVMSIGGIGLGTLAAKHKDRWVDNVIRIFAYLGVVTPSFVMGILLLLIFGLVLNWFPSVGRLSEGVVTPTRITGLITIDALIAGNFSVFLDALKHLALPAVALAMGPLAQEARLTRTTMAGNLEKDYIAAASAVGIPDRIVMGRFLLKPSLIPTISILGLDFAGTLSNAFLLELIFNWPGISRYGMNAMLGKDLNAISAVILTLGVLFIVVNIVVDMIVTQIDPRIRLSMARGE